jgi:hypothetical protein
MACTKHSGQLPPQCMYNTTVPASWTTTRKNDQRQEIGVDRQASMYVVHPKESGHKKVVQTVGAVHSVLASTLAKNFIKPLQVTHGIRLFTTEAWLVTGLWTVLCIYALWYKTCGIVAWLGPRL